MRDIKEFSKLFKIHIPVDKYQNYYINELKKSKEYFWLDNAINFYKDYTKKIDIDVAREKHIYMNRVIDFLKDSKTYKILLDYKIPKDKLISLNEFKKSIKDNNIYLSIDLSKANYQTFKYFDTENELRQDWFRLCDSLQIPRVFQISKSFRQHIFGNLNPKKTQRIQNYFIDLIYDYLCKVGYQKNIVSVTHDEIILTCKDKKIFSHVDSLRSFIPEPQQAEIPIDFSTTIFTVEEIEKDYYVRKLYEFNFNTKELEYLYSKLKGVPGNQYYIYFKKYILKENINDKDLFFINDGKLAKWVV